MSAPCAAPLEPSALVDYWLDGGGQGHEALEAHLFECDACSRRLQALVALGEAASRLLREGAVELVVTPSLLAKAARDGLRVREYRLAPGERVSCTVTPEDDWLVSRLLARFEGVSRVDLVAERLQGAGAGPRRRGGPRPGRQRGRDRHRPASPLRHGSTVPCRRGDSRSVGGLR